MLETLFILSAFTIPFNDFIGIGALGELQHELSAYFFLLAFTAAIVFSLRSVERNGPHRFEVPRAYLLPDILKLAMIVIFFSFATNFPTMLQGSFRGRFGVIKFITSTMVVGYGFGIAYLTYFLTQKNEWHRLVIRPVAASIVVCTLVACIEVLSWHGGFTASLYSSLSHFLHSGSEASQHNGFIGGAFGWGNTEGRARGLCFEAPALANFMGMAWPWAVAGIIGSRGTRKFVYIGIWMMANLTLVLAASRTSYVLLASNLLVWLMLRYVYLPPRLQYISMAKAFTFTFWCLFVIALVTAILMSDDFAQAVAGGTSMSNISRYASNLAAFGMFADNPLTGTGFGQFGFHALKYMPNWGWHSWEIRAWYSDPMVVWPPVFSMFARFAAELGLPGVVGWVFLWYYLARRVIQATLAYQKATGVLLARSYPLVISCYGILFAGIANDSLRLPFIWITLGLSCCYLHEINEYLSGLASAKAEQAADAGTVIP